MDGPWDEVVFVSHSNGTIYAMSVLRRLFELRGDRQLPANFTVLTLGQVVPVIALRKDARWYHADLKALDDKPFRLVDFSAPPDGAAYHGVRSEEHTSELQSLMRISYAVFCLKKK